MHHKAYALACKFFEYTFEPLLSDISTLFYGINFHKFVGNMLYLNMFLRHERAIELSKRFEAAVRNDDSGLRGLLSLHVSGDRQDPIEQLISFGIYNRDSILGELARVNTSGGWTLELTMTSISSLLAYWGDRFDSLIILCDSSMPVRSGKDMIDMMVGQTEKLTLQFGDRQKSMLYNLDRRCHR